VTNVQDQDGAELPAADQPLLRELTERARTGGVQLTREGGLLGEADNMVVESALEGELNDHLGNSRNDPARRNGGNSRNGYRAKTVLTEAGRHTKCHACSTAALRAATRCGPPDRGQGTAEGSCPPRV
jgi:hypothetical protein